MPGHAAALALWHRLPAPLRHRLSPLLNTKHTVGVIAVIIRGDYVLLAEHTYQEPRWSLPGGYVGDEQPAEALRREIGEELGMTMTTCRLVHAERPRRRHLTLFYRVEVVGTFRPSAEVSAWRPFALDALPADLPPDQHRALVLAAEA